MRGTDWAAETWLPSRPDPPTLAAGSTAGCTARTGHTAGGAATALLSRAPLPPARPGRSGRPAGNHATTSACVATAQPFAELAD